MKTPLKNVVPRAEILEFRDDLKAVITRHKDCTAEEILATVAHMLGGILALQDQRRGTSQMFLEIIQANMAVGNAEMIDTLFGKTKGSA